MSKLIVFSIIVLWLQQVTQAQITSADRETMHRMIRTAMNSNPTETYNNGKLKGQKTNGLAAYYWNNRDFYFGNWSNGNRSGFGILIWGSSGEIYVGNFVNGEMSGTGTKYDATGKLIYYGNYSSNNNTGTSPSTGYDAYKFEIQRIGSGGDLYVGETRNGKRYGKGLYLWNSGEMWYGDWRDGERAGVGLHVAKNGSIFTGTWSGNTHQANVTRHVEQYVKQRSSNVAQNSSPNVAGVAQGSSGSSSSTPKTGSSEGQSAGAAGELKMWSMIGNVLNSNPTTSGRHRTLLGSGKIVSYTAREDGSYYSLYLGEGNLDTWSGNAFFILRGYKNLSHVGVCSDISGSMYYIGSFSNGNMSRGSVYDRAGRLLYHGDFREGNPTGTVPSIGFEAYRLEIKSDGGSVSIYETKDGVEHGASLLVSNSIIHFSPAHNTNNGFVQIPANSRVLADNNRINFTAKTVHTVTIAASRENFEKGLEFYNQKNFNQAIYWWERSDQPNAMHNMGLIYFRGEGVEKDYEIAKTWIRKAIVAHESGNFVRDTESLAGSERLLGRCYHFGDNRDYNQAIVWYSRAAAKGDGTSMFYLGVIYDPFSSHYDRKDGNIALYWYERATENKLNLSTIQTTLHNNALERLRKAGHVAVSPPN